MKKKLTFLYNAYFLVNCSCSGGLGGLRNGEIGVLCSFLQETKKPLKGGCRPPLPRANFSLPSHRAPPGCSLPADLTRPGGAVWEERGKEKGIQSQLREAIKSPGPIYPLRCKASLAMICVNGAVSNVPSENSHDSKGLDQISGH